MGGSGSGRWGWHTRRATVEDSWLTLALAACRDFLHAPAGTMGSIEWTSGAKMGATVVRDRHGVSALRVTYRAHAGDRDWQHVEQTIRTAALRQHLGGERLYF